MTWSSIIIYILGTYSRGSYGKCDINLLPVSQKALASHNCRSEVIDQLFQDKLSLHESGISINEVESSYAYLGSHEVDLNTVSILKSAVTSNPVALIRHTLSSEASDCCKDQQYFSRGK